MLLAPFVNNRPKQYKGNKGRIGYRFWTRSLPVFTPYYHQFYDYKGRKHIPNSLQITPLALAVWYMDDGAKNRKSAYLNTQQFSIDDQRKLLQKLKVQYKIEGNLNKDKQYFRIRLYQNSSERLKKIIYPYMIPSMKYKLPL